MSHLSCYFAITLDSLAIYPYSENLSSRISTYGQITILLGKQQVATGERMSPRKLAAVVGIVATFAAFVFPVEFTWSMSATATPESRKGTSVEYPVVYPAELPSILVSGWC